MAEVTLADYTGYLFLEVIKAREMADRYSRQLAETYAKDKVLQYFSVPRFKVPKIELTIPVLVSGARFEQLVRFNMPREKFVAHIVGLASEVVSSVRMATVFPPPRRWACCINWVARMTGCEIYKPHPLAIDPKIKDMEAFDASIEPLAGDFWQRLQANPDPSQPGHIVRQMWPRIFEQALAGCHLVEAYRQANPNNELLKRSLGEVLQMVSSHTTIDSTAIQSLLVNPETNVVKNGSSDASVFTIKAEMVEEGFFIREIRDEDTGQTRSVVEFE